MGEVTLIDTVETGSRVWTASIQIAKEQIRFKLDSGAESTYHKLQVKPELQGTNKVLLGPCNYKMECLGKYSTKLSRDERSTEEEIYVIQDSKVSVCVDLSVLNNFVQHENHPLPSVEHTLGKLTGSKHFSKLDANSGFWQIKLSEESRHLTTFITPWGRYYFNVLPYGISSGSEKFQKSISQILERLEGVQWNTDDVSVHAATQS